MGLHSSGPKTQLRHKAQIVNFNHQEGKSADSKIAGIPRKPSAVDIRELNEYLQGWLGYFRIQEFQRIFKELDEFIRSRLRSMQLKKWKNPRKFQKMMIKAKFPVKEAKKTWVKMNRWQSVLRTVVRFTLNIPWFRHLGVLFLNDSTQCAPA